ncbi:hypothetical protein BS50DRAFT_624595 [Corynespora cassiicola Philippines]|uniref:NB-ARC domain-containing protein n=1 Tax=Corynespora cassiicola Philippines TaxID=1448308 RepID=A0A2T2NBI8_CORCC|nr:hypothetical protein BS50DRAFT_624595 [Corynespora cassiicola Philippines]
MAEPFAGVAAAASIIQIVHIGFHVANRIRKFSEDQYELPENLEDIRRRLDVFIPTLQRLRDDQEAQKELGSFLDGLNEKVKKLEKILSEYLPPKSAPRADKIKAGLKSLGKDEAVRKLSASLESDAIYLETYMVARIPANNPPYLQGHEFFEVPHRIVAHFTGRKKELDSLNKALDKPPQIVILQAMGGQGKTQLAFKYCEKCRATSRFKGIFWVNSNSEAALRRDLETLSGLLKPPEKIIPDSEGRIKFVYQFLTHWKYEWLLVMDNYDDPGSFKNIMDYMPKSEHGRILITSRDPDTWRLGKHIPLAPLDEQDAVHLLLVCADIHPDQDKQGYGADIVRRLGYLPLAIDQAGSYIRDQGGATALATFLRDYEEEKSRIWKSQPTTWDDHAKTVFTTWELAFSRIDKSPVEKPGVAEFIHTLGYFHHENISESLFQSAADFEDSPGSSFPWDALFKKADGSWSHFNFKDIAVFVKKLGLVSTFFETEGTVQLSLHPLVGDWLRVRSEAQTMLSYRHIASRVLSHTISKHFHQSPIFGRMFKAEFSEENQILAHIRVWRSAFSKNIEKDGPIWIPGPEGYLCAEIWIASFLYHLGEFRESQDILELLARYQDRVQDPDLKESFIRAIEHLSTLNLRDLGLDGEHSRHVENIIQRRKNALGSHHTETLWFVVYKMITLGKDRAYDGYMDYYKGVLQQVEQLDQSDLKNRLIRDMAEVYITTQSMHQPWSDDSVNSKWENIKKLPKDQWSFGLWHSVLECSWRFDIEDTVDLIKELIDTAEKHPGEEARSLLEIATLVRNLLIGHQGIEIKAETLKNAMKLFRGKYWNEILFFIHLATKDPSQKEMICYQALKWIEESHSATEEYKENKTVEWSSRLVHTLFIEGKHTEMKRLQSKYKDSPWSIVSALEIACLGLFLRTQKSLKDTCLISITIVHSMESLFNLGLSSGLPKYRSTEIKDAIRIFQHSLSECHKEDSGSIWMGFTPFYYVYLPMFLAMTGLHEDKAAVLIANTIITNFPKYGTQNAQHMLSFLPYITKLYPQIIPKDGKKEHTEEEDCVVNSQLGYYCLAGLVMTALRHAIQNAPLDQHERCYKSCHPLIERIESEASTRYGKDWVDAARNELEINEQLCDETRDLRDNFRLARTWWEESMPVHSNLEENPADSPERSQAEDNAPSTPAIESSIQGATDQSGLLTLPTSPTAEKKKRRWWKRFKK